MDGIASFRNICTKNVLPYKPNTVTSPQNSTLIPFVYSFYLSNSGLLKSSASVIIFCLESSHIVERSVTTGSAI